MLLALQQSSAFSQMKYKVQVYYNVIVLFFQMSSHSRSYAKISFTPVKGIHMNNGDTAYAIYFT